VRKEGNDLDDDVIVDAVPSYAVVPSDLRVSRVKVRCGVWCALCDAAWGQAENDRNERLVEIGDALLKLRFLDNKSREVRVCV
jgi:hypothetical protein